MLKCRLSHSNRYRVNMLERLECVFVYWFNYSNAAQHLGAEAREQRNRERENKSGKDTNFKSKSLSSKFFQEILLMHIPIECAGATNVNQFHFYTHSLSRYGERFPPNECRCTRKSKQFLFNYSIWLTRTINQAFCGFGCSVCCAILLRRSSSSSSSNGSDGDVWFALNF